MMNRFLAAAFVACSTVGAASATTVTYDFEEFMNGEAVTSITRSGVTASVTAIGGVDSATICNTDLTPDECDDPDLLDPFDGVPGSWASDSDDSPVGNVLIVQERDTFDGSVFDPADDNASGGELIFSFNKVIELVSVTILDIERDRNIDFFLDGTELTQSDTSIDGVSGDNLFELFAPENFASGRLLRFDASTSFAIDNISVNVVPLPAGLPLLLTGLGGLALIRRRRKAA